MAVAAKMSEANMVLVQLRIDSIPNRALSSHRSFDVFRHRDVLVRSKENAY